VGTGDFRPTDQSYQVFDLLSKELEVELAKLNGVTTQEVPSLNAALRGAGISEIKE
jgi:hypothetical protein